jgi:hypothetical protein
MHFAPRQKMAQDSVSSRLGGGFSSFTTAPCPTPLHDGPLQVSTPRPQRQSQRPSQRPSQCVGLVSQIRLHGRHWPASHAHAPLMESALGAPRRLSDEHQRCTRETEGDFFEIRSGKWVVLLARKKPDDRVHGRFAVRNLAPNLRLRFPHAATLTPMRLR